MKAKKEAIKEQGKEEISLLGTFLENIDGKFEKRNKEKAEKALMRNESRNVKRTFQENRKVRVISRQNLIEEQCDNSEKDETVYNIVVPKVHRREILELAHDLPMSGHLGVRKTCNSFTTFIFGLASKETW